MGFVDRQPLLALIVVGGGIGLVLLAVALAFPSTRRGEIVPEDSDVREALRAVPGSVTWRERTTSRDLRVFVGAASRAGVTERFAFITGRDAAAKLQPSGSPDEPDPADRFLPRARSPSSSAPYCSEGAILVLDDAPRRESRKDRRIGSDLSFALEDNLLGTADCPE